MWGLERLQMILDGKKISKEETLRNSVNKIIDSGFRPSNNKQGYVLKKLLRECFQNDVVIEHEYYDDELKRQGRLVSKWNRLKDKHSDKPKEWWWDTMGIDLDLVK